MSTRATTIGPDRGRRRITVALFLGTVGAALRTRAAELTKIEVWTGPDCSCCRDWVKYLQGRGFDVTTHNGGNGDARKGLGMPVNYGSCHTAATSGYAIEGHVPVREIRRLLVEQPDAIGLTVPAMPRGSPGMDAPIYGGARDPFDVLLIRRDGTSVVYQSYR
jgi:hypothetical protein